MPIRKLTRGFALGLALLTALAAVPGCSREGGKVSGGAREGAPTRPFGPNAVTLPSGIIYEDLKVGDGPRARAGLMVSVHYSGWLTDGTLFDTSLNKPRPFVFRLGEGEVIRGWDEGLIGLRVGGKRRLKVPPDLAYGDKGVPGLIPPGATLVFQVELFGVN
jgi:FKBP-type peptidyl-prolyl cis-trans isomerase FkpA